MLLNKQRENAPTVNGRVFMMDTIDHFSTSDLALVALLRTEGFVLEKIDRTDARRVMFCFRPDDRLIQTVNDFWAGKLLVEPVAYFQKIKEIKNRIYAG